MSPGNAPIKQTWQERCVQVYAYHMGQLKVLPGWTMRRTAAELKRSIGGVAEDIQLAEFLRAHPEMGEIKRIVDAIEWVREYKRKHRARRIRTL